MSLRLDILDYNCGGKKLYQWDYLNKTEQSINTRDNCVDKTDRKKNDYLKRKHF